jgi:beta-glucosidase
MRVGDFNETLYIDYQAFLRQNIEPDYSFGYGLTYTDFEYLDLKASLATINLPSLQLESSMIEGGQASPFETLTTVEFKVTNTGKAPASEVAQLYVGIPNAPARQLRGFEKRLVQPGVVESFHLSLNRRDLSIWNVGKQSWVLQQGIDKIYILKCVLDIQLRTSPSIP